MVSNDPIHNQIQEYYGKTLQSSQDLKTSCCTAGAPPPEHREIMALIDDEIVSRFYGCGSPIPDAVEGLTVLDLGCGTGRDCYVLSKLVGPEGSVTASMLMETRFARHFDVSGDRNMHYGHFIPKHL
jgi:arsenite methyltransferase